MKPQKSGYNQKRSNHNHSPNYRGKDPAKEKLRQERMQQAMDRLARFKYGQS